MVEINELLVKTCMEIEKLYLHLIECEYFSDEVSKKKIITDIKSLEEIEDDIYRNIDTEECCKLLDKIDNYILPYRDGLEKFGNESLWLQRVIFGHLSRLVALEREELETINNISRAYLKLGVELPFVGNVMVNREDILMADLQDIFFFLLQNAAREEKDDVFKKLYMKSKYFNCFLDGDLERRQIKYDFKELNEIYTSGYLNGYFLGLPVQDIGNVIQAEGRELLLHSLVESYSITDDCQSDKNKLFALKENVLRIKALSFLMNQKDMQTLGKALSEAMNEQVSKADSNNHLLAQRSIEEAFKRKDPIIQKVKIVKMFNQIDGNYNN